MTRVRFLTTAFAVFIAVATPVVGVRANGLAPEWQLHVPVIYYHHIACPSDTTESPNYWTCPDQFRAQLQYIRDAGWTAATVDQLAEWYATRICPPDKTFVVSFDDGDADAYTNAAPILESLGMRGTFFVIAGRNGTQDAMTNDQIADLAARGHAIGNHTLDHANLRLLDPVALRQQIEGAQQVLEQVLGYRPRTFAYPYGRFSDAVVQAVAESGFDLAFTIRVGAVETTADPLLSKRIHIGRLDSGPTALAKIAAYADPCPGPTPDLAIGKAATGPFRGWHVVSPAPVATETVWRSGVRAQKRYSYSVQLRDASNSSAAFSMHLDLSGAPHASVAVFQGGSNITSTLIHGTYSSPTVGPWSSIPFEIRITPGAKSLSPPALVVDLYATYQTNGLTDAVRAVATY